MDTKRFLIGAVVGLVVFNVLGFLTFDMALGGFYEANAGSATGVEREAPIFWAAGVAGLLHGALLVMVMDWAGVGSVGEGFKVSALVGLLFWGGVDFLFYGFMNLSNLTLTIVDPLVSAVFYGVIGAVIYMAVSKMAGSAAPAPAPAPAA